jgi:quinol monooxygenase YgiN
MIVIFARTRVHPQMVEKFETAVAEYERQVNATEPGCMIYCMARSTTTPYEYRNVEIFADQDAIEAHGRTEHYRAAIEATVGCLDGEPAVERCESLQFISSPVAKTFSAS